MRFRTIPRAPENDDGGAPPALDPNEAPPSGEVDAKEEIVDKWESRIQTLETKIDKILETETASSSQVKELRKALKTASEELETARAALAAAEAKANKAPPSSKSGAAPVKTEAPPPQPSPEPPPQKRRGDRWL